MLIIILFVSESDSEPEEASIGVSRPHHRGSVRRTGGVVSGKSAATTPRGILKDGTLTLTNEEQKKRVRFSLEGRSLADTTDHTDTSSNEDDIAVEMKAGDSDSDEITKTDDSGEIKVL